MGLFKLLVLILLIVAVMVLWRRFQAWQKTAGAEQKPALMVRCAHCKVNLPENQAVREGQHWFCSSEHRDAGPHD